MRLTEERKAWRKDHPFVRRTCGRVELRPSAVKLERSLARQSRLPSERASQTEADLRNTRHPILQGFYARPRKEKDSLNLLVWDVGIPGKEDVRVYA